MRVLWLSHFVPYPPKGGNLQRSYYLLRGLSREAEVDLVSFHRRASLADPILDEAKKALSSFCRSVHVYPIPNERSRITFAGGLARNLLEREPYTVAELRSAPFREKVRDLLRSRSYDAVHFDTVDLATYRVLLGGEKSVLNHHNIESRLFRRRAPYEENRLAGLYLRLQAAKLERFEDRWYEAFDRNLFVSAEEMETIASRFPTVQAVVVPNGVDTGYYRPGVGEEEERVVWVGGLGWFPNRDAVSYLTERIWPLIRERRRGASLDLVGAAPERLVPKNAGSPGIVVHGFVDDLRPIVARAAVVIVPLRVGGGTRLKVLDAMAMGKAIVSTTVGFEGIDAESGKHLVAADRPEEIAEAVARLLGGREERTVLGRNARKLVEERYDWNVVERTLVTLYRELAGP